VKCGLCCALCGLETSCVVLQEKCVGGYRQQGAGGVFGAKGNEVTGDWRKLGNEEFNGFHT